MDIKTLESFKLSDAVKFHNTLNPKLWRNQHLRPEVKDQLILIAQDFLQELGISDLDVVDMTVSGSNAAYSYTDHSDLDLHLLVDMSNMSNDDVYLELFNAKKTLYNDSHDIKIHGIPVELYVQDAREPVVSLGEYSILNDKWLRLPTKRRSNFDQTATKQKYSKLLHLIQLALQSKDLKKVSNILKTVKQYRQAGLDLGGEFGPENLAYKMLRSQGWLTRMYELKDKLHSEKLTIETIYQDPSIMQEADDEIHNYKKLDNILAKLCRMVVKGQHSDKDYGMVAACVLDPDNNIVAGLNSPGIDNKRVHAERVAIEKYEQKYGSVPKGSIIVTTLSPCNESDDETADNRVGESCTDYLNDKGIEKVYCGYIDPTQDNDQRQFNLMETGNQDIRKECKKFADTFLKNGVEETYTMQYAAEKIPATNPYGGLKDIQYRGSISESMREEVKENRENYNGINILLQKDDDELFIKASAGSKELGHVLFVIDGEYLIPQDLEVDERYRNQGIASTMYDYVKSKGYKIRRSGQQTDAGAGFWDKHRPEQNVWEASGYIPSEKEKNDPRFKTALTVDIKPDSIKKNAKSFYWKTSRAGIPPQARTNGKY